MPPPGILMGLEPTRTATLDSALITASAPGEIHTEYRDTLEVQPWAFLRMLAKIAHSFAVAELGWQRFCEYRPLLKSIILDTSDFSTHYIGCVAKSIGDPKILHWLSGNVVCMDGRELFIVDISLFSFLKRTPVYRVVVAEKNITPEAESK